MSPVALVTGGAVRAGRAITLALADAGYDMVVNYHSSEEAARSLEVELTGQGREVLLAPGDVSDAAEVERIGQGVRDRFGRLDVLINSAATFISTPLLEIESQEVPPVTRHAFPVKSISLVSLIRVLVQLAHHGPHRRFQPMSPVALVTGGAVRAGRAITLALADAGYDMVVNYHSSEEAARSLEVELTGQGREVLLAPGDVSDAAEVERIGQGVRDRFGRLDVLINSAATFISTPLLEIESQEWDRVMGVNLKGPHLLVREFAPLLRSSRGSIVNLADHMGLKPWVRYAHHSIAKAGLVHLTQIQAVALAPEVRVNAVAPGLVLAPEEMSEAAVEREVQSTLLRRSGTPEDLTRTVLFLVESPFITGQTIIVDGGGTLDQTPGFY